MVYLMLRDQGKYTWKVYMENTVHSTTNKKEGLTRIILDMESHIGEEWWVCALVQYNYKDYDSIEFDEDIIVESKKENCVQLFIRELYETCQEYVYVDGWYNGYDDTNNNAELEYLKNNNLEMFICEETFEAYLLEHSYIALPFAAIILQKITVNE